MLKNILYSVLALVASPLAVFAQNENAMHQSDNINTLLEDHWHDIPSMILFILAAIFAFRVAVLYGGIIGKALNLMSIGLLIITISIVTGDFLLHLINAEESVLHYGIDFMEVIGAGVIALAFWRLNAQTRIQLALGSKK